MKEIVKAFDGRLGYDDRYFHNRPWRIPDFGINGYMHSLGDWRTWNARPEAERRTQWDALTMVERRSARGLVEAK